MPDAIPTAAIMRLARGLRVSRSVFETAFDEIGARHRAPTFMQLAETRNQIDPLPAGAERDRMDFAAAMERANADGWLVAFVFQKFSDLSAGVSDDARPELQSMVNAHQHFAAALDVTTGTMNALRRCCLILSERPDPNSPGKTIADELGSGFLIGPHLVLTNHHVVAGLLDPVTGTPKPDAVPLVRFDYHMGQRELVPPVNIRGSPDWLFTASPSVPGASAETAAALAGHLDYAILRLDGRPGHARGHYDIAAAPAPPAVGVGLELWQFPKGQPMKVVGNVRAPAPQGLGIDADPMPPRIHYLMNALHGSSGGLVLDGDKRPVAMHDAGFEAGALGGDRVNRAIPLALIARHAGAALTAELVRTPPRLYWSPGRALPILGRTQLQEHIHRAIDGRARIIAVLTGPDQTGARRPRIGRSFTHRVLSACLPPDRHHVLLIETSQIDPDPFVTARRIVGLMGPEARVELPGASGETTLDADATGVLVDRTVQALLTAAPGKTVWLMIDDIDADPIGTQWGASDYLVALYRRAVSEPRLRIVLAGLPKRLEGLGDLQDATLVEYLAAPPGPAELNAWIEGVLTRDMPPDEFSPRLAALLRDLAEAGLAAGDDMVPPGCPTEALARLLTRHAQKAFLGTGGAP
ncbi:trypsin-like serine peptidase [Rhodovulum visakhapatnamense]|uniref:Trypsin-like peptidase n=1 Tax=Rhodovulum visakhapatnamense TaxID=364297 RepID=A0A4R8GBZ9_9RHOB|nr:serine protease [Rhodovulum visakhapatnamense]TDX33230.1 trypsin-like peptidase [Rhodovulum visakhapatnamense]